MYTIRHLHKKKGFTIVELVVVMAVIGVLAAILVPVLLGVTIRANRLGKQHRFGNQEADRLFSDNGGRKPQELYAYGGRLSRGVYFDCK